MINRKTLPFNSASYASLLPVALNALRQTDRQTDSGEMHLPVSFWLTVFNENSANKPGKWETAIEHLFGRKNMKFAHFFSSNYEKCCWAR